MEGKREFLGLYNIGGAESSYSWQECYIDLYKRGVRKILLAIMDGLPGNEQAFKKVFPKTDIQECLVHHVRCQLSKVKPKHKAEIAEDMRRIYGQSNSNQAENELEEFTSKWQKLYPSVTRSWNEKMYKLIRFLHYPAAIRKSIYTTNWIERMNREFRRVLRNKSSFPTSDSALKLMFLKIRDLEDRYSEKAMYNFGKAEYELAEMMAKRYDSK
jgi:transposase-like protein